MKKTTSKTHNKMSFTKSKIPKIPIYLKIPKGPFSSDLSQSISQKGLGQIYWKPTSKEICLAPVPTTHNGQPALIEKVPYDPAACNLWSLFLQGGLDVGKKKGINGVKTLGSFFVV